MSINATNNAFYVAAQSAKGTAAAAAAGYFLSYISGDVRVEPAQGRLQSSNGGVWGGGYPYAMPVNLAERTLRFVLSPKNAGAIVAWLLGADAVAGIADPYSHAITVADTGPYLTMWRMVDGEWTVFEDVKIESWKIGAGNSGDDIIAYCEVTVAPLALPKHLAAAPASLPAQESARFDFWQGNGAYLVDAGSGAEAAVDSITAWEVSAEKQMSLPNGEDVTPYDAFEGRGTIMAGYQLLAVDHTIEFIHNFGAAAPADAAPLSTSLQSGSLNFALTETPAAPGPERSISFDVNDLTYDAVEKATIAPDNSASEQSYNLRGTAEGVSPITVTVKNGVTAAYIS